MKATALILILILYHLMSWAQNNPSPFRSGAMWWYNVSYGNTGGFQVLRYTGDTIIDHLKLARVSVEAHEVSVWGPNKYRHVDTVYQSLYFVQDSLGLYQYIDGKRGFLYPYSAEIGQTWEVTSTQNCCGCRNSAVQVVDRGVDTIQGDLYPWLKIGSDAYSVLNVTGRIYPTLGPAGFPFVYPVKNCTANTPGPVYELMCYQDDLTFVKFTDQQCDYLRHLSLTDPIDRSGLVVFPNPASDQINVSAGTRIRSLYLHDSMGRELYRIENHEYNTASLPAYKFDKGTYFLTVNSGSGREVRQVVIQ